MKKFLSLFLLLVLLCQLNSFSQSYSDYDIKGQFDNISVDVKHTGIYYDENGLILGEIDVSHSANLGDGICTPLLVGYLNLYKTTKDKAYLVKFVDECIRIQQFRFDHSPRTFEGNLLDAPLWTSELFNPKNAIGKK